MGPKDFYELQKSLAELLVKLRELGLLLDKAEEEANQKDSLPEERKKLESYILLLKTKKKINNFHIDRLERLVTLISLLFTRGQRFSVYDAEFKIRALVIVSKIKQFLEADPRIERFLSAEGVLKGIEVVSLLYSNSIGQICESSSLTIYNIKTLLEPLSKKLRSFFISEKSFVEFLFTHYDHAFFKEHRAIFFSLISAVKLNILEDSEGFSDFIEKLNYQGWLAILSQLDDTNFQLWYTQYNTVNVNLLGDIQKQNILFGENFETNSENIEKHIKANLKVFSKNPRAAFSIYTIFCDYYLCVRQRRFEQGCDENAKKDQNAFKKEMNQAKKDVANEWSKMGAEDFEQIATQGELPGLWQAHTFLIEKKGQSTVTIIEGEPHSTSVLHQDTPIKDPNIEKSAMGAAVPRAGVDNLTKKNAKDKKTLSPWDIDDQNLVDFVKEQIIRKSPKRFGWFLSDSKPKAYDLTLAQRGDSPDTCEDVLRNGNNVTQIEQMFKKSSLEFSFFRSEKSEIIYKEMTHVRRSYSAVYFLELILKEISSMDFRKKSIFSRRKNVEYTVHDENGYEKKKSKLPAFFAEIVKICKAGLAFRKDQSPYSAFLGVQQKLFRYCNDIEKTKRKHRHLPKAQKLLNLVMSEKAKPILEMDKEAFFKFLNIAERPTANNAVLAAFYTAIKPFLSTVNITIDSIFKFGEKNNGDGLGKLNKEKSNLVDYVCYKLFNFAEEYFYQKGATDSAYQIVLNQLKEIFICNKPGSSYTKISDNPAAYFRKEFDDEKKYYRSVVKYLESNIPALAAVKLVVETKPDAYDYSARAIKQF